MKTKKEQAYEFSLAVNGSAKQISSCDFSVTFKHDEKRKVANFMCFSERIVVIVDNTYEYLANLEHAIYHYTKRGKK